MKVGMLYMMLVACFQATLIALAKLAMKYVPASLCVIFYYLIPLLICFFAILLFKQDYYKATFMEILSFAIRGALASASIFILFQSLRGTQLSIAVLLFNTTPIFVAIISITFLKEQLSIWAGSGLIISVLGVYFILKSPVQGGFNQSAVLALLSAVIMAIAIVMMRFMTIKKISTDKIVFYLYFMATIFSSIYFFVEKKFCCNPGKELPVFAGKYTWIAGILLMFGVISLISQKTMTKAFKRLPASLAAPFLFIAVPISAIVGNIFWGQNLSIKELIGAILVISGVSMIVVLKKGEKNEKAKIRST